MINFIIGLLLGGFIGLVLSCILISGGKNE